MKEALIGIPLGIALLLVLLFYAMEIVDWLFGIIGL